MEELQEKIDNYIAKNGNDESSLFEWLQGDKYPGSCIHDNGTSGTFKGKRWWTLYSEDNEADFYL